MAIHYLPVEEPDAREVIERIRAEGRRKAQPSSTCLTSTIPSGRRFTPIQPQATAIVENGSLLDRQHDRRVAAIPLVTEAERKRFW